MTDRIRKRLIAGLAAACLACPVLVAAVQQWDAAPAAAALPDPGADAAPHRLGGLWNRYAWQKDGDPMRFWFFHESKGIGLYRYGRVGLNFTNSYDYKVEGDRIHLLFRKTGERASMRFRIEPDRKDRDREWLVLLDDPRELRETRYFRRKSASAQPLDAGSLPLAEDWGRMWTCERRYATGGMGFRIYQFKDAAIDGRGVGWYHQGDYDEWSTEALTYRVVGQKLELHFTLRGERATSAYRFGSHDGKRALFLDEDPRNYWHHGAFLDGGRSFGLASPLLPLQLGVPAF